MKLINYREVGTRCHRCLSEEHDNTCERINFKTKRCCYTCGLPQKLFGEHIHGDTMTGECGESISSLIRGISWYIYRDEELRSQYIEEKFENDGKFREWLVRMDETGEILNGCRLLMNVWKDRQ